MEIDNVSGNLTTRRRFLKTAVSTAAVAWVPLTRITPASAMAGNPPPLDDEQVDPPPRFPAGIELFRQAFENWSGAIRIDELWTCSPASENELVEVVNWAAAEGYRVRPRGVSHNWSPLNVAANEELSSKVVMVDMTVNFIDLALDAASSPRQISAGAGALMQDLLATLERSDLGLSAFPAPGDITIGGALAIGGHGTGIPAAGESRSNGMSYGSLSNLVLSLTAVVHDEASGLYSLKTFKRDNPEIGPLLTHLGRALITQVTLQVGNLQTLRCKSSAIIPNAELFAAPESGSRRKLSRYLAEGGRVEAIWFPFTDAPWLKVWSLSAAKPFFARRNNSPYPYTFADNISRDQAAMYDKIIGGAGFLTPAFGGLALTATALGLFFTGTLDIWGASKNMMLYVKPTTLRVTANGYAILTRRRDVQRVVHEFTNDFKSRLQAYKRNGKYPVNGPVEIRVTGLDQASEVDVPNAVEPSLSAVRPRSDKPEWDVAVWLDILTFPGTDSAGEFFNEVEDWLYSNYTGDYAGVRVEWSKGYAYTGSGAWENDSVINERIPASFNSGQDSSNDWNANVAKLSQFDPHRVYSSPFLDRLMP